MAVGQYRKQPQEVSERQKQALLARVMEQDQVDASPRPPQYDLHSEADISPEIRVPDWFAD